MSTADMQCRAFTLDTPLSSKDETVVLELPNWCNPPSTMMAGISQRWASATLVDRNKREWDPFVRFEVLEK